MSETQPTIAPVVEYAATDGVTYQLCWSFSEIRKLEHLVPGARVMQGLLMDDWTFNSILLAFVGSARTKHPRFTIADAEALMDAHFDIVNLMGKIAESWAKSRKNPSIPAGESEPAANENS